MHSLEVELGISKGLIKDWKRQAQRQGQQAFPGHGHLKADEAEMRRLHRELELLRQERDILKKAIAIFSQGPR
jgi:transposase